MTLTNYLVYVLVIGWITVAVAHSQGGSRNWESSGSSYGYSSGGWGGGSWGGGGGSFHK